METAVDLRILRKERYAFRCGERRVSWRAVKLACAITIGLLVLGLAIRRAVARGQTVWEGLWDVGLVAIALVVPSW
jgi:hypothetical protein